MPSPSTTTPPPWPLPRACRILVVDDEQPIRLTVAEILRDEGYPVLTASNGTEALHLLDTAAPQVVLLDMRMPLLDGWAFMAALRQRGAHPAVLVMTAAPDARAWAAEVQADGYLAKPFDLDALLEAVAHVCASQAAGGTEGDQA